MPKEGEPIRLAFFNEEYKQEELIVTIRKYQSMLLFLSIVLFMLTACDKKKIEVANKTTNNNAPEQISELDKQNLFLYRKSTIIKSNQLLYLYKKEKNLYLRKLGKDVLIESDVQPDHYFWLNSSGSYVYVFWWEKYGSSLDAPPRKLDKTLYVKTSTDGGTTFGKKIIINNTDVGRPLANLKITSDESGNAAIIYLDERYPAYEVFINTTQDGGKTWSKDLMINDAEFDHTTIKDGKPSRTFFAVSPTINIVGKELVAIWHEASKEGGRPINRLYSRVSLDWGKSWQKEEEIFKDSDNYSLQIKTFQKNNRLFLVATQTDRGLFLLHRDTDSVWKKVPTVAPETEKGRSASYIAMDADNIFLYLTYVYAPKNGGQRSWQTVLQRFDYLNNKWISKPLRMNELNTKNKLSRGSYQDVTVLSDGTVIIVWQDFRFILPTIMMSYSLNQGEDWSNPVKLKQTKKGKNYTIEKFPYILKSNNDQNIHVMFESSVLKEGLPPYVFTKSVEFVSPRDKEFKKTNFAEDRLVSEQEKKNKLNIRIKELMELRISKKWNEAWEFIDPVYRNLYSKKSWLKLRNRIIYSKFSIESVKVNGSYGRTKGWTNYDIGNNVEGVSSKDNHLKNQRKLVDLTWGWFGDDWYYIAENPRAPYLP